MEDHPEIDELLESLDLSDLRVHGPPRPGTYAAYERDLTEADMAALELPRGGGPVKALARIHASHHSVARCLAAGMKATQVALVTGYTPVRVSQLQQDSAFQALVADYRAEVKSVFANLAERMNDLSLDAIELLHERLHDGPENFTVPVLLEIVKTFADRTGHGPGQDVNLRVSTDLIDRPPRETFEEWTARRARELDRTASEPSILDLPALKRLN